MALYNHKAVRIIVLLILALMAAVSLYRGVTNALHFSQDFQWDAAKALTMGIDPYTESLSPTGALSQGELKDYYAYYEGIDAPQKMEANQFPSLLMLLYPYTLLAPSAARLAWLVTNLLCTLGIVILLRFTFLKDCDRFLFASLCLLMVAGTPYRNQLGVGQHTLFSVFFFLFAVYLSEKKYGKIPAALSLFVSFFKYTLTAPLSLYFLYKKKWIEWITSVLLHVLLTGCAAVLLKKSFLDMILSPLKVSSALLSEGGLDFGALFHGSAVSLVLAFLVGILLFVLSLKAKEGCDARLLTILLLWSLIMLYHRTYDFFVLIMAASYFTEDRKTGQVTTAGNIMTGAYILVLYAVFFLLRQFHESAPAMIFTGILYYLFTIAMTVIFCKNCIGKKNHELLGKA